MKFGKEGSGSLARDGARATRKRNVNLGLGIFPKRDGMHWAENPKQNLWKKNAWQKEYIGCLAGGKGKEHAGTNDDEHEAQNGFLCVS